MKIILWAHLINGTKICIMKEKIQIENGEKSEKNCECKLKVVYPKGP